VPTEPPVYLAPNPTRSHVVLGPLGSPICTHCPGCPPLPAKAEYVAQNLLENPQLQGSQACDLLMGTDGHHLFLVPSPGKEGPQGSGSHCPSLAGCSQGTVMPLPA
jgi:hypothetical protein